MPTSTNPNPGEYQHVVLPSAAALTEFYQRANWASIMDKVLGPCKIGQLTLRAASGEKLRVALDWVARGIQTAGVHPAHSFADIALLPFVFKQLVFKKADAGGVLAADTGIENFEVIFNQNLVTDKHAADGTYFPAGFPEGKLNITGSFTREFEDTTDYDRFVAATYRALEATFTGPTMGVGNYELKIELPNVVYTAVPLPGIGGGNDRRLIQVSFAALYHAGTTAPAKLTLNNKTASY
jgi:hypothetical protein